MFLAHSVDLVQAVWKFTNVLVNARSATLTTPVFVVCRHRGIRPGLAKGYFLDIRQLIFQNCIPF